MNDSEFNFLVMLARQQAIDRKRVIESMEHQTTVRSLGTPARLVLDYLLGTPSSSCIVKAWHSLVIQAAR